MMVGASTPARPGDGQSAAKAPILVACYIPGDGVYATHSN